MESYLPQETQPESLINFMFMGNS